MSDNSDKSFKPGFDARMHYYNMLRDFMIAISHSQLTLNFELWIRSLQGYLDITQPFIKESESREIFTLITSTRKKIYIYDNNKMKIHSSQKDIYDSILYEALEKITQMLYRATKYMLLPIKDEGITEWDEDEFRRGSDI